MTSILFGPRRLAYHSLRQEEFHPNRPSEAHHQHLQSATPASVMNVLGQLRRDLTNVGGRDETFSAGLQELACAKQLQPEFGTT